MKFKVGTLMSSSIINFSFFVIIREKQPKKTSLTSVLTIIKKGISLLGSTFLIPHSNLTLYKLNSRNNTLNVQVSCSTVSLNFFLFTY